MKSKLVQKGFKVENYLKKRKKKCETSSSNLNWSEYGICERERVAAAGN